MVLEIRRRNLETTSNEMPARNEVVHAYSDHSKVMRVFGHQNKHSLGEGIHRMAEWARKAGARKSQKFNNIEIMKNLPRSWME